MGAITDCMILGLASLAAVFAVLLVSGFLADVIIPKTRIEKWIERNERRKGK